MAHVGLEALRIALDIERGGLVGLGGGELEQLARIADALGRAVELADVGAQAGAFAPELLRPGGVRPDGGVFQLACDFLEPLVFAIVLKETPGASPCGRRGP